MRVESGRLGAGEVHDGGQQDHFDAGTLRLENSFFDGTDDHRCIVLFGQAELLLLASLGRRAQAGIIQYHRGTRFTQEAEVDRIEHGLGPRSQTSDRFEIPGSDIGARQ